MATNIMQMEQGKFEEVTNVGKTTVRVKIISGEVNISPLYSFYDEDVDDISYNYYGFSIGGNQWVIKRQHKLTNAIRIAQGDNNYSDAWSNRSTHSYGY
jgi:hypothetical protein